MRKIFILGLALTLSALFGSGCRAKEDDSLVADALNQALANRARQAASTQTGAPSSPEPSPERAPDYGAKEPEPDYAQIYSEKLKGFYELIIASPDEHEPNEGETGIMEVIMGKEPGDALNGVGYAIQDVNGDEIPELLICAVAERDAAAFYGSEVLAAYTCVDGVPRYCFEGWGRSGYSYLDDGDFLYQGSGGAMYSMFGIYALAPDGKGLYCKDYYFTLEKDDSFEELSFYHNTSGEWDRAVSEELKLTAQQFWSIAADYEKQLQSIKLIPFSEYEG